MQNSTRKKIISDPDQLANALGWFSVGLGVMQLLMPRTLCRLIGVNTHPILMRLFGARELASGIGILSQHEGKDRWLKARVAGDALDLAALGGAMVSSSNKGRVAFATASVAGVTAADIFSSAHTGQRPFRKNGPLTVHKTITINKDAAELYKFWRNFEQLPQIMSHLQSVTQLDKQRSRWVAKGPAGMNVEWEAQIIKDKPNEMIAWRSLDGSDVDNSGEVRFSPAPGNRGTVVRVQLRYCPPAGKAGAMVAKLLGEAPEKQIAVDLLRFKQFIETGEIARTEGQAAGRPRSTSRKFDDLVRA